MSTGFSWLTARGLTDYYVDHLVGGNSAVGTTYAPVSADGIYQTPQVSGAQQLRVKAGNVNDDNAGSGARKIWLLGIDENLNNFTEVIETAGTSASAFTTKSFLRLLRAKVIESGTYATTSSYSHAGNIVIEDSGLNQWGVIDATDIARGHATIGLGVVPNALSNGSGVKELYIVGYVMTVDSNKSVDMMIVHRDDICQTTPPYNAMHTIREHLQVSGVQHVELSIPLGPYKPGTEFGFMAKAATSAACSIDIEVIVVKE